MKFVTTSEETKSPEEQAENVYLYIEISSLEQEQIENRAANLIASDKKGKMEKVYGRCKLVKRLMQITRVLPWKEYGNQEANVAEARQRRIPRDGHAHDSKKADNENRRLRERARLNQNQARKSGANCGVPVIALSRRLSIRILLRCVSSLSQETHLNKIANYFES